MAIYEPAEDSYLLQESLVRFLKDIEDKSQKILDMGTGSGIQILTCKRLGFKDLLAIDIDELAIDLLKKQKINVIKSYLFSEIKKTDKFDLIVFNPPYLPEDDNEPLDSRSVTTAGKKGYELINEFLDKAKSHLKKNGAILLLFSSLSKPKTILRFAKFRGYSYKLLSKKKIFFEELYVYQFNLK